MSRRFAATAAFLRRATFWICVVAAIEVGHVAIDLYLMPIIAFHAQHWDLLERTHVRDEPVATFRPTASSSRMAIDITPTGHPVPDPERGVAWVDPCDADIRLANADVPTTCLGLSVGIPPEDPTKTTERDVALGTYNYDGAKGSRFFIVKDRKKVAEFVDGGLVVYGKIVANEFVGQSPAATTSSAATPSSESAQ
jgi:hypothetical protein